MRLRIWDELAQAKHHECYCIFLLAKQRRWLNYFSMLTLVLSSAGIMGWNIWESIPLIACAIISVVQLIKLLQTHLIPSEKQIEKLSSVADFYFDYHLDVERLWYDYDNHRLTEMEAQERYYAIKSTEKDINKILKEILKSVNESITKKADLETSNYLQRTFNTI